MSDMEIANSYKKLNIVDVAKRIGIDNYIEMYGNDKAKIRYNEVYGEVNAKLILVTSINPTPYGEGKTTVSIGLNDGINKLGYKSLAVLREPSMGPVFGIKGGACGGGYSQVVPMDDINLHFTGDMHAITACNNLISAAIDNHIYFGNSFNIDVNNICFKRCIDMNDRALRKIKLVNRDESFNITAASEVMSVLCMSNDFDNLRENLGNIIVAYDISGNPIYVKDFDIVGSLMVILKDAIKPNLVQSLEGNPVIIHGGPFANIGCGCNSIIATKLGMKLADYVVTEAGFGSDLGAEKFLDIKCRKASIRPNVIVIVATIKALKHNGGIREDNIRFEDMDSLKKGISNLKIHIENMLKYTSNVIVTLNKFDTDTMNEINYVRDYVLNMGIKFAINDSYNKGGEGALELAKEVVDISNKDSDFNMLYDDDLSIKDKIEKLSSEIYRANEVIYSDGVISKINKIEEMGYGNLPICVAKTQYSISDNAKMLGSPEKYSITVRDIDVFAGAGYVVVYMGNIMTMPGLAKYSNYKYIDIDSDGNIKGLF